MVRCGDRVGRLLNYLMQVERGVFEQKQTRMREVLQVFRGQISVGLSVGNWGFLFFIFFQGSEFFYYRRRFFSLVFWSQFYRVQVEGGFRFFLFGVKVGRVQILEQRREVLIVQVFQRYFQRFSFSVMWLFRNLVFSREEIVTGRKAGVRLGFFTLGE